MYPLKRHLLLCFFVLFATMFPTSFSYASDEPLQISDVQVVEIFNDPYFSETPFTIYYNNSHDNMSWQIGRFDVILNKPAKPGKVTLEDQSGKIVDLTCSSDVFSTKHWYFGPDGNLKGDTSYKLTVYGGSLGPKDENGKTLPGDIVLNFKTKPIPPPDAPRQYSFKYDYNRQPYGVSIFQIEGTHLPAHVGNIYHLKTLAGKLDVDLSYDRSLSEGEASLTLVDSSKEKIIYQRKASTLTLTDATIDIPLEGEYYLIVQSVNRSYSLTVTGPGLKMTPEGNGLPKLEFPDLKDFELHNTNFDIGIANLYSYSIKSVELYIDGTPLKEIFVQNNEISPNDRIVDPSPLNLKDGIHALTYIANDKDGNGVMYNRYFTIYHTNTFTDVPMGHWAFPVVEAMHDLEVLKGRSQTSFAPDALVTRAEFATMMVRSLGLELEPVGNEIFSDVPDDAWYKPYVDTLAGYGYIHGVPKGDKLYFEPNRPITRAEAAKIIGNQMRIPEGSNINNVPFTDLNQAPDFAKCSIQWLWYYNWLKGYPDNTFRPNNNLSRAESAKIMSRYLGM